MLFKLQLKRLRGQQGPLDRVTTLVEGNLAGSTSHCCVLYTSNNKSLKSQRLCVGQIHGADHCAVEKCLSQHSGPIFLGLILHAFKWGPKV